jgi:DNA modification methylase
MNILKNIKGDITVLDPYMGSGTVGLVCKQLGLKFIGIEKDPNYFEIAKNRIYG